MNDRALTRHLAAYLGAWPPAGEAVEVVTSPRRDQPGWDGTTAPVVGVLTPAAGVVSVSAALAAEVAGAIDGRPPAAVAATPAGGGVLRTGIFRWTTQPADLADAGEWRPVEDPVVPPWLHPFGSEVLVALDEDGRYLAGVGVKRHDPTGWELSVGTEPAARGRGLARRLVAQATRRCLRSVPVVTYLHAPDNHASGRVAEASGFPDLGWRVVGWWPSA